MWQISIALWKPPWPYGCWFSHNQFLYESKEGKKQSHLKVGWTSVNHFYQNQQKYLLQRPWLKHFTSTNVAKYIFGNRIRSFTSLQATAFLPTGKKVKKLFQFPCKKHREECLRPHWKCVNLGWWCSRKVKFRSYI